MADSVIIKIGGDVKNYETALKKIEGQTKALSDVLSDIGRVSGVAFAALTAAMGVNIMAFAKFDDQMRVVKNALDEGSFGAKGLEQGFSEMRKSALDLGKTVPVSMEAINKSLGDVVGAGIDASKAVEVVGAASKLAVAGVTDMEVATNVLTNALNAYSMSAAEAESVAAKFFIAQKSGKASIDELSVGFGKVGPLASQVGVTLNEVLATISATTMAGTQSKEAFTGLKGVLSSILKPSSEAALEAARLGIQFDAASLKVKGLEQFLNDLVNANGFTEDSIRKLFGSLEAANVIMAVTGNQADVFKGVIKDLGNETKTTETFLKSFVTQNESIANQTERIKNQFNALAIQIGEKLAPAFITLATVAEKILNTLSSSDSLTSFTAWGLLATGILAGLTAVTVSAGNAFLSFRAHLLVATGASTMMAAAGTVLSGVMTALTATMAVLTSPITLTILAITAAGAAIWYFSDEIMAALNAAWAFMKNFFDQTVNFWSGYLDVIVGAVTMDGDRIKRGLEQVDRAVKDVFVVGAKDAANAWNKSLDSMKTPQIDITKPASPVDTSAGVGASLTSGLPGGLDQTKSFYADILKAQNEAIKQKESAEKEHDNRMAQIADQGAARRALIAKKLSDEILKITSETREAEWVLQLGQQGQSQLAAAEHNKRMVDLQVETANIKRELMISDNAMDAEIKTQHLKKLAELELQMKTLESESRLTDHQLAQELEIQHQNEIARIRQEARITDLDAANRVRREDLQKDLQEKNIRREEEIKYGTSLAAIKAMFRSEEFKAVDQSLGLLATLTRSKNKELFEIGKVAALAQATVNIAEGITKAIAQGGFLGLFMGTAVAAAGAVQIDAITSQSLAMANGGVVTGGIPGKDSVPVLAMPGELMVPTRNYDEVIDAVASRRSQAESEGSGGGVMEVIIGFRDNAFEIIEQGLIRRRAIGIGARI